MQRSQDFFRTRHMNKILLLIATVSVVVGARNDAPIIGLFSLPNSNGSGEYLPASYVKWLESSGARVIRMPYNTDEAELDHLFSSINGLLFIGGGANPSDASRYMFNLAVQANKNGDYFPVWGTCLGFQWISMFVGGEAILTGPFDSDNYSIPVNFTAGAKGSRMMTAVGDSIYDFMETEPITFNAHHDGVSVSDFEASSASTAFFNLLATNYDRGGKEFVAIIEGKKFPIYGTQFHPEKNMFEWGIDTNTKTFISDISHSAHAIQYSSALGRFFVDESRRNSHAFSSVEEEVTSLINRCPVTYTGTYFQETYFFAESSLAPSC